MSQINALFCDSHGFRATICAAALACVSRSCTVQKIAKKPEMLFYEQKEMIQLLPMPHQVFTNWTYLFITSFCYLFCLAGFGFIENVYVNGQNQDVWCRSNKTINDNSMYSAGKSDDYLISESCYIFQFDQKFLVAEHLKCKITDFFMGAGRAMHCICSE